jgi:hypothetical protein
MGWSAYYQILRDRPLDEVEVVAVSEFIRNTNRTRWKGEDFRLRLTRDARPDHLLGFGSQKFSGSGGSGDRTRLCKVLTALSKLLDDVEVRVDDDFNVFGWNDERGEAAMDGPTTELVSLRNYDGFVEPEKLLPSPPVPLPKVVAAFVGGAKPTRKTVAAALVHHASMDLGDSQRDPLAKAFLATPTLMRAQAGLDAFGAISTKPETWAFVGPALASHSDVTPIVNDFLAMWAKPELVYSCDLRALGDAVLDALSRVPEVEEQMLSDLRSGCEHGESNEMCRRAERAAEMLGRARSRRALLELIETARSIRPSVASGHRDHLRPGIIAALRGFDVPEVVPTLLHDVASGTSPRERGASIVTLAHLAPSRVMPILEHLVATGEAIVSTISALQRIGDQAAIAALRRLCEFPDAAGRDRASAALRALGVEPTEVGPLPPPEELVTHVHRDVRHAALRELDERGNMRTVGSFIAATELDDALAKRFGLSTRGWKMRDLLAAPVRKQAYAWLRGRDASDLPEQVIWPAVEQVLAKGADAVALTYPTPWPAIDPTWERSVLAEENAVIEALRK